MNKTLIAAAVLATSAFSANVFAAAGSVNFTGEILVNGCEVIGENGTTNQNVDLGKLWVNELVVGEPATTAGKNFTLKLVNCPDSAQKAVVRFEGDQVPDIQDTSLLALTNGADTAEGVAIQILDNQDNVINLREDSIEYALQAAPAENLLNFSARYYAYKTPAAGKANAVTNFSIIYR